MYQKVSQDAEKEIPIFLMLKGTPVACAIHRLIFQENGRFNIYSSDYSWTTGLALLLAARALYNADLKGAGNFFRRACMPGHVTIHDRIYY